MKTSCLYNTRQFLAIIILILIPGKQIIAQNFQRAFGTNLDNSFTKVIKDGSFYYVLGQNESTDGAPPTATVTRLDNNGLHQWTLTSNVPSIFNDAVLIPGGDLLVVGWTLPFDPTNASLIGRVTSSGGGNFSWLRSYDLAGRDGLTRIIENPVPEDTNFPYYTIGFQHQPGAAATVDDVVLLNLDANGSFNWKKIYPSAADEEFFRDLEVLGNGDMLMSGNNASGIILKSDNAGIILNGVTDIVNITEISIFQSGEIYATANTLTNDAHVIKFDQNLFVLWDVEIPQLSSVSQIWEGNTGELYVTGRGIFGGINRGVVVKLDDNGPTGVWIKYLNTGITFIGGSSWLMPNGQLAYTDSRDLTGGFGQRDAFISLSDLEFTTCNVSVEIVDPSEVNTFPASPEPPVAEFQDPQAPTEITIFQSLNWQQQVVCSPDTCTADFTFQIDCGVVTFSGQSNVTNPSWQWTFSGGSPSSSTNQNPVVTFPLCDTYDVCLTVTGNMSGSTCSVSTCHTVTIVDNTPPVALCLGIGVVLDANCTATITPGMIDGGSSDDCLIQTMSVSPNILTGCGEFPVTLTVTDWCGNTSICTAIVQTIEDVPPVIICPPNVIVNVNTPTPCSQVVNGLSWLSITDNCGTPFVDYIVTGATSNFGQNDASGLTYNQGVSTITYTATDDCGNTATCSFTVTVVCDTLGFPGVHCGQAVVTCFSGFNAPANYWSGVNQNAPVMALIDVRDHSTATPGTMWTQASATEYVHPTWTPQNMGQIFGIAIDLNNDIFVAASSIYTCNTTSPIVYNPFTTAGPGAIYKVDGATGAITNYITTGSFSPGGSLIPNNGSALGDIGYDATNGQFFVSNHADGMIYRIKNGLVMSRFDPFGSINPLASGLGSNPDFVARGERSWGVAYYNNRVYFATWKEDIGRPNFAAANEIWSIGLDGLGEFVATSGSISTAWADGEVLEITIPELPFSTFSNPVSDIAFSADGKMLLAERTMESDCGGAFSTNWYGYAHSSRLVEYFFNTFSTQWELTTGHTLPITASNLNLKFRTGATNSGSNSAGGCDYGYASFDPAVVPQPDCDQFVWNTGDNLHPPTSYNSFCSQPGITWLYGMQGMSALGGTNLNSLLVDFDNNACTHDKILLGDVEIFKCGCIVENPDFPCDSLWVTKEPLIFDPGTMPDTCCWSMDFHVHAGPLAFMEVESLTPGVIFNNATLSSSFQWGGTPTGTLLPISYAAPGHGIPPGDYNDALTFCLGNILTPQQDTQCVVFRWYIFGPTDIPYLACTDTCYFYCPPPVIGDTCVSVKNDSIACNPENPLEYCYFFQVQNLSDFNASQVVLSNPTLGFEFKPCPPPNIPFTSPTIALPNPPLNPGIEPDSCSPQLCVKIVATAPVLSPTTLCFEVGLFSNDSCCHSTVEHCIVLEPCCDPCEEKGVVVHTVPPVDSCCHSLDITNICKYDFFTKLELELLTPGVIFGSHFTGGLFPADWFNPISNDTLIQWQHITGSVPNGTTAGLINFCLDEIDQLSEIPQIVVLNWITTDSHGRDSIACSDTLIFDCPVVDNKCIEILEQSIECKKDENGNFYYELTMIIQNVSTPPHIANELIFTQIGGSPVTVFPNPILFSPLPFGGMTTISTFIFGSSLNAGDKLIFEIRLHDSFSSDNWCCFEGDSLCVFIPPCRDSCCTDFEAFCQDIESATSISVDNALCKVTLNVSNIPDCGNYIESVNWGDGNLDFGPFTSGAMPMHIYLSSGTYIISYLAIEINPLTGLICFEKQFRDTITLDCDGGPCPNNLVPNPSFELYSLCPTGLAPPFTSASWSLPTDGSADYYNNCASSGSGVSTPTNTFGAQAPRTGAGYAGFILRPTNLYREYLEVPLTTSLDTGITYQISFFVSLADQAQWAIDKIGAYLSIGSVGPVTGAPVLPFVPQVSIGNFITNKTTWTLVSGTYLAAGGESHLVIGNFSDNISTTPLTGLGGFYPGSYYYIDDVSVCASCVTPPCDSCCTDSLVFSALVNQGFTVVTNGCNVTVTAPQFDSCYWFGTPPYVVGGDPVSQVVTDPSGSWSFTFPNSGTYQICVTVFDACQGEQMCTNVTVECDSCTYSVCPGNQIWQTVTNNYFIQDMVVFQGQLIAAGSFSFGGANNIAAWNGTSWTNLSTGTNGPIEALTVYNNLLYAGGGFTMAGSSATNYIAKWDGLSWSPVGTGTNGAVYSLEVYGTNLVAGGSFSMAGSSSANFIAKWDGISIWSSFGTGMDGPVHGLGLYNGNLVAGGRFSIAGGASASNIAIWNGTLWSQPGSGINLINGNNGQGVKAILQLGSNLVVGGRFMDASGVGGTQFIALWDGSTWNSMATGVNTSFEGIYDLKLYGGELYAGGLFTQIGGNNISGVAHWNGAQWVTTNHANQLVRALTCYMAPGNTCELYSGGEVFLNHWDCLTATSEVAHQTIRIYPNPTTGALTLEFNGISPKAGTVQVLDLYGRVLRSEILQSGVESQTLSIESMSAGVYFVKVLQKGMPFWIEKVIKH